MSVPAMKWAIGQKVGDATAKFVLVNLAWHHNPETGLCCPSIPTIQKECDFKSTRTVQQAIKRLTDCGLLSFQREFKNGTNYRTVYTLVGFNGGDALNAGGAVIDGGASNAGDALNAPTPCTKCTPSPALNAPTPLHEMHPIERIENIEEVESFSAAPPFDDAVPEPPDDFFLDSYFPDESAPAENKKKPQEKKKAKKTKTASANQPLVKPADCSQEVFDEWVKFKNKLGKGKAECSQYMVNFIAREAKKAGITSEKAMITCMERGWSSFQAHYNTSSSSSSSSTDNSWRVTPQQQREIEEIMAQRKAAQHHQEPSFRNLSTSAKDEFDAGALDLVRGIL